MKKLIKLKDSLNNELFSVNMDNNQIKLIQNDIEIKNPAIFLRDLAKLLDENDIELNNNNALISIDID